MCRRAGPQAKTSCGVEIIPAVEEWHEDTVLRPGVERP